MIGMVAAAERILAAVPPDNSRAAADMAVVAAPVDIDARQQR